MYSEIELEEANQFPISNKQGQWEVKTTKRKIEYELRRLKENEVFGHQEVIE